MADAALRSGRGVRTLSAVVVAGGVVGFGLARAGVLPRRVLEAALLGGVFALVAVRRPVVDVLRKAGRPVRLLLLGALLASSAGQLVLGDAGYPFIRWDMYASPQAGDPTFYEWDVELRSGRREPLIPGRFLAPESADRLVETMRRQVDVLRRAGTARERSPVWTEHTATLEAVARAQLGRSSGDPVVGIVVSEQTVPFGETQRSVSVELWRVPTR